MPALKCQNCGSAEIESDSSRADSVCTKCGTVCESGIIVSDVQFEENAHGGSSALGMTLKTDNFVCFPCFQDPSCPPTERAGRVPSEANSTQQSGGSPGR